jgi:hypothetical protein
MIFHVYENNIMEVKTRNELGLVIRLYQISELKSLNFGEIDMGECIGT